MTEVGPTPSPNRTVAAVREERQQHSGEYMYIVLEIVEYCSVSPECSPMLDDEEKAGTQTKGRRNAHAKEARAKPKRLKSLSLHLPW